MLAGNGGGAEKLRAGRAMPSGGIGAKRQKAVFYQRSDLVDNERALLEVWRPAERVVVCA